MHLSDQLTAVLIWLVCLVLLGASIGISQLELGVWNPVLSLGIGFTQACLIFWFDMHLRENAPLVRFFAAGALFWLLIMFAFSLSDWVTRASDWRVLIRGPVPG